MLSISYIIGQLTIPIQEIMPFFRDYLDVKKFKPLSEVHLKEDENTIKVKAFSNCFTYRISLRSVFFKYSGIHNYYILKNFNLYIPKGKITAVVGASCSGKTTLLKLLLAFYKTQKGKIIFDNQDMNLTDSNNNRRNCGVVMRLHL